MDDQLNRIAGLINLLGEFCGKRDIPELTREALRERYVTDCADVLILFGGSILNGGDLFAQAVKNQIASNYIIVGGAGHTTETLRQKVYQEYPDIETKDRTEAEIFDQYVRRGYGVRADYLECESTNCGNNITFLLKLLKQKEIPMNSIILMQDATMQLRMEAGLRKYVSEEATIINYASYSARVIVRDGALGYDSFIHGMWDMDRYISLLMGEIPRLTDDANGYGPAGRNFISHIDIPDKVNRAFEELKLEYGNKIRIADTRFAGRKEDHDNI